MQEYDAALDARVRADIATSRRRRTVFATLSVLLILGELMLGVAILLTHAQDPYGDQAIVLSSVSAFVITLDVSLGIRERAAAHHATLNQLRGVRNQMLYPSSSALWQEYASIRAFTKINYVEAMIDGWCSWSVAGSTPPPPSVVTASATAAAAASSAAMTIT